MSEMEGKQKEKTSWEDEIDLIQLAGKVVTKWKFVLKVTLVFLLLGFVFAMTSVKEYTAEVVVVPESSKSSSLMEGGLGSLAAMAGFDLGSIGGEEALYPMLYPDIVQSLPFQASLFDVRVKSKDGEIDTTYFHYVAKLQKRSLGSFVKMIPGKIIKGVLSVFSSKEEEVGNPSVFDPYNLSRKQMYMITSLGERISVLVDKKTNVISLSFTAQDPLIAATMVDTVMCRLQDQITAYRTKKVMDDCAYIEKLYLQSKAEYEKAQEVYAAYVDRNRNVTQERFLVEMERLVADKDLKNTLYTQWAQKLMLAQAKVQEYTPVFVTLHPASVPALPSSMSRSMILLVWTFVGAVLAVGYVVIKDSTIEIFREMFGKK